MPHSHLRLALEVLHVPVVQVPQVPREHCVGAVAVAVGAHAGQVVFSQSNDAALGGSQITIQSETFLLSMINY